MNINKWLSILLQFLVMIPAAASCYFAVNNRMRYTPYKTAVLCMAVLLPYSFIGTWLCMVLCLDVNVIFLPSLVLFFFLYRPTVMVDLSRSLAIYVGVCAVQTFPAQFAHAFDAFLHPTSDSTDFSVEAAFFQFGLSCLVVIVFAYPACRRFALAVERLDFPKIWYFTVIISSMFLILNILTIPQSYNILHVGRLFYLFPMLEGCALIVLIVVYLLFYRGAMIILEHAELKERSQLLEMQSHQYSVLKEHMRQTTMLRHDFRHSVRLLLSLAEKGDIDSIRTHLEGYKLSLSDNTSVDYCANAALNALFGYYHEMAMSAGIHMDWHIELPESLLVTELDMASLFGNLMENAIDGCLTVLEDRRYFCLNTEIRHRNQLYIVSTNSFDGKVRKGKDGYSSTKHGGKGIGLVAITAIAEKYDGSAQFDNSDKEFFADVVLKI